MSNNFESNDFDRDGFVQRLSTLIGDSSYRSFAQRAGISDTVLKKYLKDSIPSLDKAVSIAKAGMVSLEWLALGVGVGPDETTSSPCYRIPHSRPLQLNEPVASCSVTPADEFTLIDSFAVFASAGHGAEVGSELQTEPMSFRTDWLKKEGLPKDRLAVIRAKGDSMEPTISDNDVILVLLSNGDAPRDGLHVIRLNGGLFVKRLQFDPFGGLSVVSDNPAYKSYAVSKEQRADVHIIGRVVWAGKKF